jgi:hypothetical protein
MTLKAKIHVIATAINFTVLTVSAHAARPDSIGHGSFVVIVGNTERLAFAADSRAIDDRFGYRFDDECKATTLGDKGLFAEVGLDTIQRPKAVGIARNVFNDLTTKLNHRTPTEQDLIELEQRWGREMRELLLGMGFDRVASAADIDIFNNSIFATKLSSGLLGLLQVDLILNRAKRTISVETRWLPVTTQTHFIAFGKTEIFKEFLFDKSSKRAKDEFAKFNTLNIPRNSGQFAEWLVSMTIKYDARSEVGGPIDSLEIDRRSGIAKWVRGKQACQQ